MKIASITAFYKADQWDGLNSRLTTPDLQDLTPEFIVFRTQWDAMWRKYADQGKTEWLVEYLLGQLNQIMRKPRSERNLEDAWLAIANVDLLERQGRLKADEFNGLQLITAITLP